jgi:hypothetical protein
LSPSVRIADGLFRSAFGEEVDTKLRERFWNSDAHAVECRQRDAKMLDLRKGQFK